MKKAAKILGIVAAVFVALLVVLVIAVRIIVTPERIKAVLVPKAAEALGREVSLGAIDVSLFSGITLSRLVVQEKEKGAEPFIAAERVVLRYQFWPLLQRRVVVDEVRLEAPRIRVERFEDGSFNFSDLPEKFMKEKDPEKKEPVDLLVSEVAVAGGELLFLDHKVENEGPYRLQVTGFDFTASGISPARPFPWELKARVAEGSIAASGKVDPKALTGEVSAQVDGLSVVPFTPYFSEKIPGRLNAATVNVNLSAEGGKEKVSSRGTFALAGIDLVLKKKAGGEIPIRDASLAAEYALDADLSAKNIALHDSTLTLNKIPVRISGTVRDFTGARIVDMRGVVPELDLRPTLASLPPGLLPPAVSRLDPGGKLSAGVRLAGPASAGKKLLQEGEVRLGQVGVNVAKGRVSVDGILQLAGDTATSRNLLVRMGENSAAVDLKASNLFGKIPKVTSAVRSDRFALDPLLKLGGAAPADGLQPPPASEPKTVRKVPREPLDLPLQADGTVQIGQTVYKGLTLQNFFVRYRFDQGVVTVPETTGRMVGGSFRSEGRVDLGETNPPFAVSLDLKGLQAEPLVNAFFPKGAGTVFGNLNFNGRLQGAGLEGPAIRRTLSGKGALVIRDGRLTGAGLVRGLADFLNLEELRVLRFSQAKGSFTAKNGKLQVDSEINGEHVRMHPQGTVALENYGLDLALQPRFSPELTRRLDSRGTVTRFLVDEQGWGRMPIKAGGTLGAPRFSLDTAAVREKVKEQAGQEIRKRLEKGLEKIVPPKKEGEAPPEGTEEKKPGTLEETFRGLFGK